VPVLTAIADGLAYRVVFEAGASLKRVIEDAEIPVRWGCRGNGACGLCRVEVEAGNLAPPAENELLHLTPEQLACGVRLACALTPCEDLHIRILRADHRPGWRELASEDLSNRRCAKGSVGTGKGLAVDLGTTQIRVSLWDLARGVRLGGRVGPNPQSVFGSDVVTRLLAAEESSATAHRISDVASLAINEALLEMCQSSVVAPSEVTKVVVVGNTAMVALLTQTNPRTLLDPGSWGEPVTCCLSRLEAWVAEMGLSPDASVTAVAPLGGFVGSDLLAAVLATDLTAVPGSVLVDFGTNSEIALWDGATLWVTSAAGGPAFEGQGLQCGMPAEPGAIHKIEHKDGRSRLKFRVIGGLEPQGLCGSGLVDLIAMLRSTGELSASGRLAEPFVESGFFVDADKPTIRLTNRDIDIFQRAKGAIGAGVRTLLAKTDLGGRGLPRVCVCGAFGHHLNAENARLIGLLPNVPAASIELTGGAAMSGCEQLLLSEASEAEGERIRERSVIVNMAASPEFEDFFLESLYLQPLEVGVP
jgi:uncharacterized 2Fe-2S/4Fe-4S cluster protein (DUF4445 family)